MPVEPLNCDTDTSSDSSLNSLVPILLPNMVRVSLSPPLSLHTPK